MRRPEIKNPALGRQLVSNLTESSEGLSETSGSAFAIASSGCDLAKSEVDPPNSFHRAGLVGAPEDQREIVPTLPIIDDSIYHDLADSESGSQLDRQSGAAGGNSKNSSYRALRMFASSQKLQFDLDPR